jgi:hypothetical protein
MIMVFHHPTNTLGGLDRSPEESDNIDIHESTNGPASYSTNLCQDLP